MTTHASRLALAALLAAAVLVAWTAPGCAPAKAEPLDVTYYYLPG